MKMLQIFFDALRPAKKYCFAFLVLTTMGTALAQANGPESELLSNIVVLMNLILSVMLTILTPAIILLGWLLSPDWTMGDFFGLRKYFLQVWILVSNLVYIVFALMLLVMAVLQIFNGEHEFAFKQKLPAFLGGILLVPFTWLIVSWTLSFANQAVAAVLSIPMGAISALNTNDDKSPFHRKSIPTELTFGTGEGQGPENFTCNNGTAASGKCISPAEFIAYNGSGPFFIILIYAYDIFQINTADVVKLEGFCTPDAATGANQKDARDCIRDLMGIVRTAGMSLIVTIFFGILTIALCWVLLMRALKLWIYVMFSPLFGLAYFSGQGFGEALHSEGGGGESMGFGQVGFVQFFKLAMVPVLVAAVLSFGLLFVGVMRQSFQAVHPDGAAVNTFEEETCTSDQYLVRYCIQKNQEAKQGYNSRLIIGSDTAEGGAPGDYTIKFNFGDNLTGFLGDAADGSSTVLGVAGGAVASVEDIFAHIIITMIALAIMWTGVKAAVNHDAVTSAAFAPFAKLGDSAVHMIQHAPSYLPLPHPAFKALTPSGISGIADAMRRSVDEHEVAERKSLVEMIDNPGLMKVSSDLKSAGGDFKKAAQIMDDAGPRQTQALSNFEATQEKLVGSLKAVDRERLSDPENPSVSKTELSAKLDKFVKEVESAKDPETRASVLSDSENASIIRAIRKADPEAAGRIADNLGAKSRSSGTSTVSEFSGFNVDASGNITAGLRGTAATATPLPVSSITVGHLDQTQISKIKSNRSALEAASVNPTAAKVALKEKLDITVDETRAEPLLKKLLEITPR